MNKRDFDYWYNPATDHSDTPCNVCGATEWTDWLLLPHSLFNEIGGYLCFPCFCTRYYKSYLDPGKPNLYVTEATDSLSGTGSRANTEPKRELARKELESSLPIEATPEQITQQRLKAGES